MQRLVLNNKGFSIASVLVAAGLFGIVSVAIAQIMDSNMQMQSYMTDIEEANSQQQAVKLALLLANNCAETLVAPGVNAP